MTAPGPLWMDRVVVDRVLAGYPPDRPLSDAEVRQVALRGTACGWMQSKIADRCHRKLSAVRELCGDLW